MPLIQTNGFDGAVRVRSSIDVAVALRQRRETQVARRTGSGACPEATAGWEMGFDHRSTNLTETTTPGFQEDLCRQ